MKRNYAVVYEQGPASVGAHVPGLPGCIAVGATFAETERLIREAIQMHIDALAAAGCSIPEPATRCAYVEAVDTAPATD